MGLVKNKIFHLGVWIKKSENNKINRENYAIVDKRNSHWSPRTPSLYTDENRYKYFEDEECQFYSDLYCEEHQERCLINYDKNMAFFNEISQEEFQDALDVLICSNTNIRQVLSLNDYNQRSGIYILVLDEYKQVYIGQAQDIKKRIMSHWQRKKPFDRLLFGKINNSVLPIDSFGALDTTRIFVLETESLDDYEVKLLNKMPAKFKLNRIAGGVPADSLDLITKAMDSNRRDLSEFHNEKFAERCEEERAVLYFTQQNYCQPTELVKGDIVCLERTNRGKKLPSKWFGEVIKASKSKLVVGRYCLEVQENWCFKPSRTVRQEIRIKKTMLFSKVYMEEKKEVYSVWRSKKFPHIKA